MLSDDKLSTWRTLAEGSRRGPITIGVDLLIDIIDEVRALRVLASATERVVRLRGWTSDAEVHPGRGEAERELMRLVEEWKR